MKYTIVSNFDNSEPFQYLAGQLVSIKEIFNEMIADSINIIEAKQKKLDDQIIKLQKSDSEAADIFYQHDYEGGRIKNLQMKEAVFQSSLIYFYSQFESALFEIVRICEKDLSKVSYKNYIHKCKKYRKGIWKAYIYIELSSKTTFQDFYDEWLELNYFRQIRNIIVHRSGLLDEKDVKIREYISNHKHLELFTIKGVQNRIIGYQVIISENYAYYISELVLSFFNKIMEKIWSKQYSQSY